ncbi:unnamed protein product [Pleuronectes platessa]|uniref:Uncharacterized protein n=1 Tax=Pleuronectes platessa TaxID=8262 RepID=A0A9N7YZU1_PLEPL|nr:unnamed protein product [Pleuronectes platessa]
MDPGSCARCVPAGEDSSVQLPACVGSSRVTERQSPDLLTKAEAGGWCDVWMDVVSPDNDLYYALVFSSSSSFCSVSLRPRQLIPDLLESSASSSTSGAHPPTPPVTDSRTDTLEEDVMFCETHKPLDAGGTRHK